MWAYTCYCERSVGSVNSEDSVSSLWGGANSISDGNFKIINYQSLYPCLCLSVFTYHKHIIAMIAMTAKERHPPAHRTVNQLRPADIDIIASLGDSITAGTGAKARNIFEVSISVLLQEHSLIDSVIASQRRNLL